MIEAVVQCGRLWVHGDYVPVLRAAGLDSLDALMAAPSEKRMDKPSLARWRQRVMLTAGGQTLFIKRYVRPPLLEQLRQRLGGVAATAQAEWRWLGRVAALGIAVPAPVAFGMRRRAIIEQQSLVVTAKLAGEALEQWVPRQVNDRLRNRAFKRRLIAATAALVARLHGAGYFHRDLYLAHIFIDDSGVDAAGGDTGGPMLALMDLQRMIQPRLRRRRWMVKDLASLNYSTPPPAMSNADRLRWLKQYLGAPRLSSKDKRLARAVAAKTRRIARHSGKRGLG